MRDIDDCRGKSDYELAEIITAAIAMFLFKEGSRNAFNNDREEGEFKANYEKLFKLKLPHMDTVDAVMRKLDEEELKNLKRSMIRTLLIGKVFHKYRFAGHWFIIAVDATGVVSYSERHCKNCLKTTSKKGKETFFHNVLEAKLICSNGFSVSLGTEWIENPGENQGEDYDKQDCESKAFKRLAPKLKKDYPRLPICITADGLYPNQHFLNICRDNQWHYILTFKEGNLPSVWKKVNKIKELRKDNKNIEYNTRTMNIVVQEYSRIEGINYCGHKFNYIECIESDINFDKEKIKINTFVHITDFEITQKNIVSISTAGRLRWKIENEGFNVQKNHGYKLQHKYSRASYQASKNYYQCLQIAHMINQLVILSTKCSELLSGKITVCHLWKNLIGFMVNNNLSRKILNSISKKRIQIRFG